MACSKRKGSNAGEEACAHAKPLAGHIGFESLLFGEGAAPFSCQDASKRKASPGPPRGGLRVGAWVVASGSVARCPGPRLALLVFEKPVRTFLVELRKFDKALSQWLGLPPLPHQQRVWVDADFLRDLLGGKSRVKPRVSKIRSRLCHLPTSFLLLLTFILPVFCLPSTEIC